MDTKPQMISIGAALEGGTSRLAGVSDTPWLDAQVLLSSLVKKPRTWLLSHPEEQLAPGIAAEWQGSLRRVEQGEPLPYVIGKWEFFNLEFEVTPDVLIPRPETELLVERAIAWLQGNLRPGRKCRLLDIGTGSGCIAIALAINVPGLEVVAADISPAALAIARRNAQRLLPSSTITFVEADLFPVMDTDDETTNNGSQLPGKYNLVTANLPYIPRGQLTGLPVSFHEPNLALDGGEDGLTTIHRLLTASPAHLAEGGLLLLEIEASQGEVVLAMARESFPHAKVHLFQDLTGRDRLVEIQFPATEASV